MFCKKILKTDLELQLWLTAVGSLRPTKSCTNYHFYICGPGSARASRQSE